MVGPNPVERGEKEREKKKEKKREEKRRGVRSSNFFLDLSEIGPSIRVGARGKVGPRIESYAWEPKSVGFVKLREVGVFLLLGLILVQEPFKWMECLGSERPHTQSRNFGIEYWIFETVSDSSGLDFWDCFWTGRKLNFGTVLGSLGTDFFTVSGPCLLLQEK